ncbi:hypothetical protein [Synoicihabitans lomoniglobus]|uniref:Uncharacterized protein n=1 Tax=Synoicihabitans lomoniglobus TaxID=2909285 RepID=A0AAF0CI31_9BACT|nr:hypothetical protein [Opitutaceae bacterium LMO-M01]WED64937.1 hypothetical protein PXH66_21530 [Opitutaceae bacterium LMO-M01]
MKPLFLFAGLILLTGCSYYNYTPDTIAAGHTARLVAPVVKPMAIKNPSGGLPFHDSMETRVVVIDGKRVSFDTLDVFSREDDARTNGIPLDPGHHELRIEVSTPPQLGVDDVELGEPGFAKQRQLYRVELSIEAQPGVIYLPVAEFDPATQEVDVWLQEEESAKIVTAKAAATWLGDERYVYRGTHPAVEALTTNSQQMADEASWGREDRNELRNNEAVNAARAEAGQSGNLYPPP